MVDAITITIIVFLVLNILGLLFFNGKYDSKITTLSNSNNTSYSNDYDDVYKMGTVNTSSIYNTIAPTMQQVKSNIVSKLDEQKMRIQEQEKKLENHKQSLLNKQQQLQNEIDKLNEQLSTSLTNEQLNQLNQIKNSLKVKINNIQSQLHGVNANNAQCVLPYVPGNDLNYEYADNFQPIYRDDRALRRGDERSVRRDERSVRRDERSGTRDERRGSRRSQRDERQAERRKRRDENPYFEDDWSGDSDDVSVDINDDLKYNECFSNIDPFVNVFSGGCNTSFAPYAK
jgi:hypothetical protein